MMDDKTYIALVPEVRHVVWREATRYLPDADDAADWPDRGHEDAAAGHGCDDDGQRPAGADCGGLPAVGRQFDAGGE